MSVITIQRYCTLEDSPGFNVFIEKYGGIFRLHYKDLRDPQKKTIFKQTFEMQAGADAFIALYNKQKGANQS